MVEKFRYIFERVHNLNLFTLYNNLLRGSNGVAARRWVFNEWHDGIYTRILCPLAHTWDCYVEHQSKQLLQTSKWLGISVEEALEFTKWWDSGFYFEDLRAMIGDILRQRMDDADAMQAVLTQSTKCQEPALV